jgi:hypothetical protein
MKPVTPAEWPSLVAKHERAGTCPACGAPGPFATVITPAGEMSIGCLACGLAEAATAAVLEAARRRRLRRVN